MAGIDSVMMARLNVVIDETRADVILSSAWRYMVLGGWNPHAPYLDPENLPAMTLNGFEYMLQSHGFKGRLIGHTVSDEYITRRENQILDSVEYNKITNWVAVDDLNLNFGEHQHRFVRTEGHTGLTDENAQQMIEVLRNG